MIHPKLIYFLEHFAIVSPLNLCDLDTTELTLFSAELPWCLVFVQKMNYQEKSQKICQKLYFTRRSTEPEDETERRLGGTTPTPGASPPLAAPGGGAATPGTPSASLCAYKLAFDLKTKGGSIVFQK